jgi:hypothetical protein
MLVYCMDTWPILKPFGIFNRHLVYVVVIWYTFPLFGMLYVPKNLATMVYVQLLYSHNTTNSVTRQGEISPVTVTCFYKLVEEFSIFIN